MTDCNLFLLLLRSALWGSRPCLDRVPSSQEWQAVYDLARRHTVQGMLYDVVKELPSGCGISRQLAAEWMLETYGIERDYARNSRMTEILREFWRNNGVTACLMKGTSVAEMYRVPEHRVSGDIDWSMPGEANWRKALDLVRGKGYEIVRDSDGDCYYVVDGIVIEHHRGGYVEDGVVGVLLMLNEHILHHAIVTGVGMRHLCDMAMAYKFYAGKYDAAGYVAALRKYRLYKWTALLNATLADVLDTPADIMPDAGLFASVPARDVRRLTRLVLRDGNFGFGKRWRFYGALRRLVLFGRYAPYLLLKRWSGLASGRVLRQG